MNKIKTIILYGPKINVVNKKVYGGGTGGYTRNMSVYLKYFKFSNFQIVPCYHTIKGEINLSLFTKPIRLFIDVFAFLLVLSKNRTKCVHILGQYRGAVVREFVIVLLSKVFGKSIIYEIKAGAFIDSYNARDRFYKKMIDIIIHYSDKILVEGKVYKEYISNYYHKESHYFPNVVPNVEVPNEIHQKFQNKELKVIFVGYAYEGKGIKELVDGCSIFAQEQRSIELTLVGQIHPDIKTMIDNLPSSDYFKINTKGKLTHSDVLLEFTKNDVYCYPTKHSGEGHNNTINEALMYGMIISSTKKGFIGDFLNKENSYPIEELKSEEISKVFVEIIKDTSLAIKKSKKGRSLILEQFNTEKAKTKLEKYYNQLF
ncbi:MAG: glycosyltransferase involved in cell wall biosynthesis [bacterium]|jgi:glycosyltransferase involved in cell wall biosynthesis